MHPVNTPTKVYILGAGCSICGGYPAAKDVAAGLQKFAEQLSATEAPKLKTCVEQTCALLTQHKVETIDALAKILGDNERDTVKAAKIAMSAYFFSLEDESVHRAYPKYAAFFDELFRYGENPTPSLEDRIKATPCRVLTYNYDRLFERAFIKWAEREDPSIESIREGIIPFLNSGLGSPQKIKIVTGQFSFLKLHGGIGQSHRSGDPNFDHLYWPPLDKPIPAELTNDNYYQRKGRESDEPTIIFPNEKRNPDEPNGGALFKGYLEIWKEARKFCTHATEIHIVGYSVQAIDYFWFKTLLKNTPSDARIIIRNRHTEKDRLERRLQGIKEEFRKEWKIEFIAEDFFGIR